MPGDPACGQLVGSSYRDAIASADTIMEMEKSVEGVVANLNEVCDTLESLPDIIAAVEAKATGPPTAGGPALALAGSEEDAAHSTAAVAAAAAAAAMPKAETDALYSAGSRVKFLVDTPEKIWGSLEEREYLGAAKRFLAARDVLECMQQQQQHDHHTSTSASASHHSDADAEAPPPPMSFEKLVAVFPLVRQQGPLLESFRAQIARRARSGLESAGLSPRACASALAAVVAVEGLDGRGGACLTLVAVAPPFFSAALNLSTHLGGGGNIGIFQLEYCIGVRGVPCRTAARC